MNIRQVNPSRPKVAQELAFLQQVCLPYDSPADTSRGFWWIAYDEGVPVGFCGLYPSSRWSDVGYLCRAGVVPEARGRGLQKALIRIRIRKARKLGLTWLLSDTYDNPASSNSLISCGFRLYQPAAPWSFKHALYFRMKL